MKVNKIAYAQKTAIAFAPLLNERELAEHLRVTVKAVQAWRYRGGGPAFVRVGRAVRYRAVDVEVWLKANTFETTTAADAEQGQ